MGIASENYGRVVCVHPTCALGEDAVFSLRWQAAASLCVTEMGNNYGYVRIYESRPL